MKLFYELGTLAALIVAAITANASGPPDAVWIAGSAIALSTLALARKPVVFVQHDIHLPEGAKPRPQPADEQ